MIRPAYPAKAKTERVYGTVLAEDFTYLFREVLPAWGSSRRVIAHLVHILANHVRHANIHNIPTVDGRNRAVEQLLADLSLGGTLAERRIANGHCDAAGTPHAFT